MLHPLNPLSIVNELRAALAIQREVLALALTPRRSLTPTRFKQWFAAPWDSWMERRLKNQKGKLSDFANLLAVLRAHGKSDPSSRDRVLNAFDHDIDFDALTDPDFEFHYFTRLNDDDRAAVRPVMESFYDFLCSPGLPRATGTNLTRDELIQNFCTANPEFAVCPACDHPRSDSVDGKTYADCDHYLPKSLYPFLAIHPANLLPTCVECNRVFKLARNPLEEFGVGRLGEVFLPYHRPAFGPLEVHAARGAVEIQANIVEAGGSHSARRNSLCRVFRLDGRWTARLSDIGKECDSEWEGWPNMTRRLGVNPTRTMLQTELTQKANHEMARVSRKEGALLRASYYRLLGQDAAELDALCARLGL